MRVQAQWTLVELPYRITSQDIGMFTVYRHSENFAQQNFVKPRYFLFIGELLKFLMFCQYSKLRYCVTNH